MERIPVYDAATRKAYYGGPVALDAFFVSCNYNHAERGKVIQMTFKPWYCSFPNRHDCESELEYCRAYVEAHEARPRREGRVGYLVGGQWYTLQTGTSSICFISKEDAEAFIAEALANCDGSNNEDSEFFVHKYGGDAL